MSRAPDLPSDERREVKRLDRVLDFALQSELLSRREDAYSPTAAGESWAVRALVASELESLADRDPKMDAWTLCKLLSETSASAPIAALADQLCPRPPDRDPNDGVLQASRRATDAAVEAGKKKGWLTQTGEVVELSELGRSEGASWYDDWR